jgi:hypothetical protein
MLRNLVEQLLHLANAVTLGAELRQTNTLHEVAAVDPVAKKEVADARGHGGERALL